MSAARSGQKRKVFFLVNVFFFWFFFDDRSATVCRQGLFSGSGAATLMAFKGKEKSWLTPKAAPVA